MNLTARGRTWAYCLTGTFTAAVIVGAGWSSLAPNLHTLDATVDRVYGAVNAGDLTAIYNADPDCDGLDLTSRAMSNTLAVNFDVISTRVAGNHGTVDTAITIPGQVPAYGTATWQLTADGTWRLAADGEC